MKKLSYLLLIPVLASSMLSCKKGENDPGISLRARDARIRGEWKLTNAELSRVTTFYIASVVNATLTDTRTETYDGTTWTRTDNGNVNTDSYALKMTLDKEGKLSSEEVDDGRVRSSNDEWFWLNSKKNKSEISVGQYSNKRFDRGIYNIDRLSNKELVLTYSYWEKDLDKDGDGDETTIEEKWTFQKQ